jgi:hypothetical protein
MANDIIGGPEPTIFNGRLFQFSPLTDAELSRLDSWLSFRLGKPVKFHQEDAYTELTTVEGAAFILFLSTLRTDCIDQIQCSKLLEDAPDEASELLEFWHKLNFAIEVEVEEPDRSIKEFEGFNSENVYIALSEKFGWTPQQISNLTPYQQYVYIKANKPTSRVPLTMSVEEYQQYQLKAKQ